MNSTKKENLERKFQLSAEEIDQIMEELTTILSDEPIDRKEALRLRFVLEETLLC